jgi:DNA-binding Lrp family transcriptional regulator
VTELDVLDRALLERLQSHFPLTPRPFAALGQMLGVSENEVLGRVRHLKDGNIIRQIGAIFDTRCLGYLSTLAAFHVAGDRLAAVAAQASAHRGVSHNYARLHHYNLWFTMAVPPDHDVVDEISRLAQRTGVEDWLNLPATRVFKVKTHFGLDQSGVARQTGRPQRSAKPQRAFSQADIPFVRALQGDLPLIPRPFAPASRRLGLSEEDLLSKARELEAAGIMRRFSAVLRHRRVGYTANGMACWVVPDAKIEKVGLQAAAFPQISHCYQRPAFPPRWPYSLFTMIHGKTTSEVEAVVSDIARQTDIEHYEILYSTREFKKERVRYFEEVT